MPLPPRNLAALHLSVHPSLAEVHAGYPLSCYAPLVALLKLTMLDHQDVPVIRRMEPATWMTLACLDDLSADYVISTTVASCKGVRWNAAAVNAVFVHSAAPFLVPMLVPVPPVAASPPPPPPPPRRVKT